MPVYCGMNFIQEIEVSCFADHTDYFHQLYAKGQSEIHFYFGMGAQIKPCRDTEINSGRRELENATEMEASWKRRMTSSRGGRERFKQRSS